MLIKTHKSRLGCKIVAAGKEEVLSSHLKTASSNATFLTASMATKMSKYHGEISRTSEGTVDLSAEMSKHPDALWIRVKAIEANIPNDNGDCFDREEIIKSYKTFEGVPVFTNHENNKIENAKGKVILAEWSEEDQSVYCTMFIDRHAYPGLCRAVEEGYATDVSMGTQVDYSVCSICENKSRTADTYCDHVKTMKGRTYNGQKVYEKNYGLKFIELSVVTDGACKDCTIREILDPEDVTPNIAKAAGLDDSKIRKTGREDMMSTISEVREALITKNAGQDELRKLNEAMTHIEEVARAMLDQRQYIDLEFLSKLTDVLADLQHVTDELVDQGYGSVGAQGQAPAGQGVPQMEIPPITQDPTSMAPNPSLTGPANTGVGTVTSPVGAASVGGGLNNVLSNRIKDLREKMQKFYEEARVSGGNEIVNEKNHDTIKKLARIWENPSVRDFKTEVSEGELKVVVGREEVIGMQNGPNGWNKVASIKVAELDADIRDGLVAKTSDFAVHMLDALKTKLAGKFPDAAKQHEQTMEAQLRDQKGNLDLHPRTNDVRESITEKQLNQPHDGYDKHKTTDDPKHTITEKQLSDGTYDDGLGHERKDKNVAHEETIELQLRDKSIEGNSAPAADDRPWAAGVNEQHQEITQKQLEDWRKSDKGHNPEHEITEKQLKEQGDPWGRRIASKDDAKKAIAASMTACAKTAIAMGATPDEIIAAISRMTGDPKSIMAAEKLASGLSQAKAQRADMLKRASFHGKKLSASASEIEDYLLGSLVDTGMSPNVAMKAASYIPQMANAADVISSEITKESEAPKSPASKHVDFFKEALSDASDESVRVDLAASEIKEKSENEEAFAKAAFEVAKKVASQHGIKATKTIHVEKDGDIVHVSLAGTRMTEAEIKESRKVDVEARKEARKQVLAQMPAGGAMPGAPAGGAMGGGGTTMPTAAPGDPMGGTPPVSALTGDEGMGEEPPMDDDGGEAVPPGTKCFVCGSRDVDVTGGEWHCNNCGGKGTISVNVTVTKWPDTLEEKATGKENPGEEAADMGGFGDMTGGPGMEMPQVGVAASFQVTPEMVKKSGGKALGGFCPSCGSEKVKVEFKTGHGRGECNSCAGKYQVNTFVHKDTKDLYARVEWQDTNVRKLAHKEAKSLINAKAATLDKALVSKGLKDKFAKADVKDKATIIAHLQSEKAI